MPYVPELPLAKLQLRKILIFKGKPTASSFLDLPEKREMLKLV